MPNPKNLRQIPDLKEGFEVRSATAQDIWKIRRMVLSALLDPTQLRWSQFWVIVYHHKIIACGQLRTFSEAQELGSMVVSPAWRGQGIGLFLTQWLIEQATSPLYLECLGDWRAEFYTRLGFIHISFSDLPPSVQQKFRLSALGKRLIQLPVHFMHCPIQGKTETR